MDAISTYEFWLKNVTSDEKQALEKMSQEEIVDAFSGPLSFGTAGMRGTIGLGLFRMNKYMVRRATKGLAEFILTKGEDAMNRGVVISYDTRRKSKEFALEVAGVLSQSHIKAYIFESTRPVPMCSYAIRYMKAFAGVMITASHNPKEYNGYKVYGEDGAQMSPEDTAVVVSYIDKIENPFSVEVEKFDDIKIEGKFGKVLSQYVSVIGQDVDDSYYQEIEKLALSSDAVKNYGKDLKLVYTPIHGSGAIPVKTILSRLGIKVSVVNEQEKPDTEFSTVSVPNPENKDTLTLGIKLADKIKADVVIGTDPDCDRMGIAVRNENKEFVALTGNQIGILLLDYILSRLDDEHAMPENPAIVKSFVSTTLADEIAKKHGVTTITVPTGFKFIGEKIKEWERNGEHNFVFGFEESFGSLRGTHARDKDAVVASMMFAEMTCYYMSIGKTPYERLIEIFDEFGYYVEKNTTIQFKGFDAMEKMSDAMNELRKKTVSILGGIDVLYTTDYKSGIIYYADGKMGMTDMSKTNTVIYTLTDNQFVCVRPSGTEPKLKFYVLSKAATLEESQSKAEKLMVSASALIK